MKFLCIPCNEAMRLQSAGDPEAGSMAVGFHCPKCGHDIAMLTNAGETQLVQSLGVRIGSANGPAPPMAGLRTHLTRVRPEALTEDTTREPVWTESAEARLKTHPRFVQPVIRKTCTDYARRQRLREVTPEVMDAAQRSIGAT